MFQIGDKVKLTGCPWDEQIPEEAIMFSFLSTQIMTVTRVSQPDDLDVPWTGEVEPECRWIKTDKTSDWIDRAWFKKAEE
jgi:hypothetical protein